MDNPLLKPTPLTLTPSEEVAVRQELLQSSDTSLLELRRQSVEAQRQQAALDSRELNLEAVRRLNDNISELVELVSDPAIAQRVAAGIKGGKDFAEFVKGVQGLAELRDKLLDRSMDETANTGKKKRILAQFQGQGVKMVVGVETD